MANGRDGNQVLSLDCGRRLRLQIRPTSSRFQTGGSRAPARLILLFALLTAVALAGAPVAAPDVYEIPAEGFEEELQARVALAKPGDNIVLPAGTFRGTRSLTVATHRVVIRGQGRAKTRIDYSGQEVGAQSWLVIADDVSVSGLTLVGTPADGIVARGTKNLSLVDVGVEWEGAPSSRSGGYGLYPVHSSGVRVERCYVRGAREAGIYVGQSQRAIVEDNLVEGNVIGIDVENSMDVRVLGNVATGNSIGVVVAARPGLLQHASRGISLIGNEIRGNNLPSFAIDSDFLSTLGASKGAVVVGSEGTLIERNTFADHHAAHLVLLHYQSLDLDERADPYFHGELNGTEIAGNRFSAEPDRRVNRVGGWRASSGLDVVWDGLGTLRNVRAAYRPVPLCRRGQDVGAYLNTSSAAGASSFGEDVPECSQAAVDDRARP